MGDALSVPFIVSWPTRIKMIAETDKLHAPPRFHFANDPIICLV